MAGSGSFAAVIEKSGINGDMEKGLKIYKDAFLEIKRVFYDFKDKTFNPPDYEIIIEKVTTLNDCFDISMDAKSPCMLVNLDIKNGQNDSITFELTGRTIVTKDGKQLDKYGGMYNTKQLNNQCDTANFFKLFPKANKNIGVCFPVVSKDDAPIMYLGVTANGKQKEHNFDLSTFIP